MVDVGSSSPKSSTTLARPSTATLIVRPSGPVSSIDTRDPSGAPPSLPTTKPMLAAISSSARSAAGPTSSLDARVLPDGVADVVLVHPAVEYPHPHEPSVAVRTRRRRGDVVPRVVGNSDNAFRRSAVVARYFSSRSARTDFAQLAHPALVHHADVVADVLERGHVDVGLRRADALQHRLHPDQVGDDVVHVPPRKRCRGLPLGVAEPVDERVNVAPHREEAGQHRWLVECGHGTRGAAHWRERSARRPRACVKCWPQAACRADRHATLATRGVIEIDACGHPTRQHRSYRKD